VIRVEHSGTVEGFAAVSQDFTLLFDTRGRNKYLISSLDPTEGEEKDGAKSGTKGISAERPC
jgi:hypothetical protein